MHETHEPREIPAEAQPPATDDPVIVETCPTCISGIDATVRGADFEEALTEGL